MGKHRFMLSRFDQRKVRFAALAYRSIYGYILLRGFAPSVMRNRNYNAVAVSVPLGQGLAIADTGVVPAFFGISPMKKR